MLKKTIVDSNIAAQDSALDALPLLISKIGTEGVLKVRGDAILGICEKALISTRESTRKNAIESLLLIVEFDKPEPVIQDMIPFLSSKLPKLVTAIVNVLGQIYATFGCNVVDYNLVIEHIPKLFAHADRNVRAETQKLSIIIRSYIGSSFEKLVFDNLKPIQQKDLTNAFSKIDSKPEPTRLLKIHQNAVFNDEIDGDVEMEDAEVQIVVQPRTQQIDPWESTTPVDIISKLPADFNERLMSSKWKDRLEVLKEVLQITDVLRIKTSDFSDLTRSLAKALKDSNVFVVMTSAEILVALANGIRSHFDKYIPIVLEPLLERTKEKKKTVTDALGLALDACFKYSSLNEILQPTIDHMNHKTPQIKFESMQFLLRCLRSISQIPAHHEVDLIMEEGIKLLTDSQLIVRDTAAELIGTLMKIIGSTKSRIYMEKVDKRHQRRIEEFSVSAVINIENVNESASVLVAPLQTAVMAESMPSFAQNKRKSLIGNGVPTLRKVSESTLPSKRGATSPLKKDQQTLTTKSLKVSNQHALSKETADPFDSLKKEWLDEKKQLLTQIESYQKAQNESIKQVMQLNEKLEDYQVKYTTLNVTLRTKETTLVRLQSDLNNSRQREQQLEQRIRSLEQHQGDGDNRGSGSGAINEVGNTSFERKSNEINNKISSLTIEEQPGYSKIATSIYDFDDNDDSWKRATAVTNDLKAKIQRMKARTRTMNNSIDQN